MGVEFDTEQVPRLALVPVGSRPDRGQAGHVRIGYGGRGLDPDPGLVRKRANLPDDREAGIARRPVDGRGIQEVVKTFLVLEVTSHLDDRGRVHDDAEIAAKIRALLQRLLEALAEAL